MQRNQSVCVLACLAAVLCLGCHSGPAFTDDAAYRAIERDADQNSASLAVTGASIAAVVERIDGHAERVQAELGGLGVAIEGSGLAEAEQSGLLRRVAAAQAEAAALRAETGALRGDVGRLNTMLAEQREISAALSAEHDRREAAAAAARSELGTAKEELAKAKGRRNLYLVMLIAVCAGILGYAAYRALRFLRVIPV